MKRKKILLHGTADTLQKFLADAVSRDFEVVALLSDEPEKISVDKLDVLAPQEVPAFVLEIIDAIIFTADKSLMHQLIEQGFAPTKIIPWDAERGWQAFNMTDADGTPIYFLCGLEFHIRNADDEKFFNEIAQFLFNQRRMKNLNPQFYPAVLTQIYQSYLGRPLDLDNPQTFTEKMQWLKLYDSTPIKSRLADKYLARYWIADKIGAEYLIPLYGVWDDFDDIDFDALPDQFVLKCNHGCGMNIIVRDKSKFDVCAAREKINAWLAVDFACAYMAFELHYTRIKRRIIAEKFMANGDLPDLIDYKFWCLHGKPVVIQLQTDTTSDLRIDHFDLDWKLTDIVRSDHPNSEHPEDIPPPKNFALMKKLAATLAEGFAFVRVDFYEIDGRVYMGEMTFTPGGGMFNYKSAGTDEFLGKLLTLPEPTPPPKI